jgi:glutamine synthetase
VDVSEREARSAQAQGLLAELSDQGVMAVAATFVDNSGITRVKTVPLDRLPLLAAWGVGISTCFDRFRCDDWIAGPSDGSASVGDLRIIPDLRRLVTLAAQPGWAWAPADRYQQSGEPHAQCNRLLLQRVTDELAGEGFTVKATFEIEWVVSEGLGDDFTAGVQGPGYGMTRLVGLSDYSRDVLTALAGEGVSVDQFHPEYAPGQLELSVAADSPTGAADTSVLVRSTIRAVGAAHGLRTSFSPKVAVPGVGNGGHVHLSLWRDDENLMAGGAGRFGLSGTGEAFSAGILSRLPALLAVGAPSVVSYLRLVPSHWAGAYACWGLENREAAMRMVTGSTGSTSWAANMEVKCFDLLANPYLLLAALLVAGSAGISEGSALPDPIDVDPAALDESVLASRGITRLPTTLGESLAAFEAEPALTNAFGSELVESIVAVRQSEMELFADASDEDLAAATRWLH